MENTIDKNWLKVFNSLEESQKRWFAAQKAQEIGYGGISCVSNFCGLSRTTITRGIHELNNNQLTVDRVRVRGGGRKKITQTDQNLLKAIKGVVEENSAGDPMTMLKWTCKSTRSIAESLNKKGFDITHNTVGRILKEQGYSLQSNKKVLSGKDHPDSYRMHTSHWHKLHPSNCIWNFCNPVSIVEGPGGLSLE